LARLRNAKKSLEERALFMLARTILALRRPMVVGVTGSVGKTTTTQMILAVLGHPTGTSVVGSVRGTQDNMNDWPGLPMVILGYNDWGPMLGRHGKLGFWLGVPWQAIKVALVEDYPRVLVLEYSTVKKGDLQRLVNLVRPHISVVTTIGPSHLEGLGSVEGVAHEKATLVRATRAGGFVALGEGHGFVSILETQSKVPVIRVAGSGVDLARNIARCVARQLGISDSAVEEALARAKSPKGRLNPVTIGGITVIDDSFNANPLSMHLGLDVLGQGTPRGRRIAVLGSMAELGEGSVAYHQEVGRYARQTADMVIGVGEPARDYAPDEWFPDSVTCAQRLPALLADGDRILVKGSSSVKMHLIVKELARASGSAASS